MLTFALSTITAPTLVMIGAEDQAPLHEITDLAAVQIAGAQKVVIPAAGHHPNTDVPYRYSQIFLEQQLR